MRKKNYSPEGKNTSKKVVPGQPKVTKRHCFHLKLFLSGCHVHINGTSWYLNKVIFDENWDFSRKRKIFQGEQYCREHIKEVPKKTWVFCTLRVSLLQGLWIHCLVVFYIIGRYSFKDVGIERKFNC